MHKPAQPLWLVDRSIDPVDRQRVLLSGSGPDRPGGRPAESFCSLYPGLGRLMAQRSEICPLAGRPGSRPAESFCSLYLGFGRPGGRPMAQRSEIRPLAGRSGGRPTTGFPAELSPTASFWSLFIWGSLGLFSTRFEVDFQASFSYNF